MFELLTSDDTPSLSRMGGKGYALAQLSAAGFPVPEWVIVAPPEMDIQFEPTESEDFSWPETFLRELREKLSAFPTTQEKRFAVRSSALEEDGAKTSFAGQLESYLNVDIEQVPNHVIKVWRSARSERVQAYRKERGLAESHGLPAVLLQRMVPAESAGVAFSADVVSGSWSTTVVSAVRGLGEQLVSGQANADTWRHHRNKGIVDYQAATRDSQPVLNSSQVEAIAAMARRCERFFGVPQDIEWAWLEGKLHLLQSRSITSLHRLADPEGIKLIWDNSNIVESYSGITTPLTFSFARDIYREVYRQFCLVLHVSRDTVENNRTVFDGMLGLIRGRIYYNLISWYRVLAMLPGFRLNRRFMEQMMGVREEMPESVLSGLSNNSIGVRIRDGIRLAWAITGLLKAQIFLPRMIRHFYRDFDQALHLSQPIEQMRADELATHFHHLQCRLLSRWNAPLINDFFAMIYFGLLRNLTRKWCQDKNGSLQNGLLCGTGKIISTQPAQLIQKMAQLAEKDPALVECLNQGSLRQIEDCLNRFPELQASYHDYLQKFADRCLSELKLESPTLRDDPLPLLRSVGAVAQRIAAGHKPDHDLEERLQREATAIVQKQLQGSPLRRILFRHVLKQARNRVRDRENLRFKRTELFGRIRMIFMELGKRLHAVHALHAPRDIFYLEVHEVLGFIEGTATTTDLSGLVALRRAEFSRFAEEPPPSDRFETHGMVHIGNTFQAKSQEVPAESVCNVLQGIGCCPGQVRGIAKVVMNPNGAVVNPGEILVAEQTDPGWITLFPCASAILVERGSLLSHSAIVSRELGIPSIVSIQGLIQSVRNGDEIEMDGSNGLVKILHRSA